MSAITLENTDALNAILTIEVAKDDYFDKVNKKLKDYRKKAQIKGFRPGKVPMGIIKRKFGNDLLIDEINTIVGEGINNYINDNKLKTIGQPILVADKSQEITIRKPSDYTFKFEVGLAPEFELQGVSLDHELPYYEIQVEDEAIEEEIERARREYAGGFEDDITDIIDTDMLVISLEELDENGEVKEDGVVRDMTYLAMRDISNDELKENLLSATIGDSFDVNVFEMEDKPKDHVRKHVLGVKPTQVFNEQFRLNIKEIKRVKKAELNEEFFNRLFPEDEIATVEEFNEKIKERILESYKQTANHYFNDLVFDNLLEQNNFDLPVAFLQKWLGENNPNLTAEYFESKDFDNFKRSIRWQLVRERIAEEHEIEVTMDEIKERVRYEVMQHFNFQIPAYGEMMDNMINRVMEDKDEVRRRFDAIMDQKVVQVAADNTGKDVREISKEDFDAMVEKYREEREKMYQDEEE